MSTLVVRVVTVFIVLAIIAKAASGNEQQRAESGPHDRTYYKSKEKRLRYLLEADSDKCFLRLLCTIGANPESFGAVGDMLTESLREDEELIRFNWIPHRVVTQLNSNVLQRNSISRVFLGIVEWFNELLKFPFELYQRLTSERDMRNLSTQGTTKPLSTTTMLELKTWIPISKYLSFPEHLRQSANRKSPETGRSLATSPMFDLDIRNRSLMIKTPTPMKLNYAIAKGYIEGATICRELFPNCEVTLEDLVLFSKDVLEYLL